MDQLMVTVMPTANALARNTLLETSAMKLHLDTTNSQIPNVRYFSSGHFKETFLFFGYFLKFLSLHFFIACECNMDGSEDNTCNDEGQCNCKCNIKVLKYYAAYDDDCILINEFISFIFIGRQM